jgi:hypothetical protein
MLPPAGVRDRRGGRKWHDLTLAARLVAELDRIEILGRSRHLAALQGRGKRPRLNGGNSADAAVIRKVKPNGLQRPTSNR